MFDNVFNDKQWKTARDLTGLKGGLTEKVSMGDELKKFHQTKTVAAAKILQQKIALYEKQLRDKHTKEKYYAKLLKLVQDQKAAIEEGIQAVENPVPTTSTVAPQVNPPQQPGNVPQRPVDTTGKVVSDKEMDDLVGEVMDREKEHWDQYENTNNDPNVPAFPGEARRIYLKLTKEFPTVEGKIKSEGAVLTDLLKRCKDLETNPNLGTKPEVAISIAQKIVAALHKIETKSTDLQSDFVTEGKVVRKEQAPEHGAVKELDRMTALLQEETLKIADTSRACRLSLKNVLQKFGNNPQAQEILGQLHI